ncbi:MAG: S9 family peptidase, partial [Deltaproteobacteria bacterium]|nr:S9 family peptidase [Deltaproteobacteria bacterium]
MRILLVATMLAACGGTVEQPESTGSTDSLEARKEAVTETYHGVAVTEDYRWLEDSADPKVQAWSEAQNAHARAFLDGLTERASVEADVRAILAAETVSHWGLTYAGQRLFAMKRQPPKAQPFLVELPSFDEPEGARVIVDPEALDPDALVTIDWYEPSPDGALLAVSLSRAGTESGDVHLFRTDTGEATGEVVPRVNGGTAGGALAWLPDGRGFYYTRYPRPGERPDEDLAFYQQVYLHALGADPTDDHYELGADLPRIAEIDLCLHRETGQLLVTVQDGDGGEFAHFLRASDGAYRQLSNFDDRVVQILFASDGQSLFLVSFDDAPKGQVLRMPVAAKDASEATVVVPEGEDTVVSDFGEPEYVTAHGERLYVTYQLGGPSQIRAFELDGTPAPAPEQHEIGTVAGLTGAPDGTLLFETASFVDPWAFFRFDPAEGVTHATALVSTSPVDFSGFEVVREFATSKDGTQIPVNILKPKGILLDGSHPAVVTGYGGYGVNITPSFRKTHHALLSRGVITAVANLRGGGEYGEEWHLQGNLTHKQNVFDDFHAVLTHLVQRGYTAPERLGIMGGSNGGLLMGATFTQHPDAAKAVVSTVGIYDMLRVELSANGAFNVPEFGTVKDEAQFRALHAYSPYHRVVDGTAYP